MRNLAILTAVLAILAVPSCTTYHQTPGLATQETPEAQEVRELVLAFGEQLEHISLLADDVRRQLQAHYAPYVSEALLAAWLEHPDTAPGRLSSSPWPDRIEIETVRQADQRAYLVNGRIVMMTSVGVASEADDAGSSPVWLRVERLDAGWRITGFEAGKATLDVSLPPFGTVVTLSGEVVCLPKTGPGPVTMECALGLRDASGDHYGLTNIPEDALREGLLQTGTRLTVTGLLTRPEADTIYYIVGSIEVELVGVSERRCDAHRFRHGFGLRYSYPTSA